MANPVKKPGNGKAPTPSQVAAKKEEQAKPQPATTVQYPEPSVELCRGTKALTPGRAKVLLGWETEAEHIGKLKAVNKDLNEDLEKFGGEFFLTDLDGNKVRLHKNTHNRPWAESISKAYMYDMLNKQWKFNGESIIIGTSGRVLSGQHRLIGLVFAEQARNSEAEKARWEEFWGTNPVTIETSITFGIDESPETTRTIDNVKTRTLSDVIYADTQLFGKMKGAERKQASRMLDYAVKLLWVRTGEDKDGGFKPVRTHSTSLAFVDRHSKLRECIAHILEEEKGDQGRISQYCYLGHAAALMYLMATSATKQDDIEDYFVKRPSNEKVLNFDNMKKAKMFWSELARGAVEMKGVRLTRFPEQSDEPDNFSGFVFPTDAKVEGGKTQERLGVLVKAWNLYVKDEELKDLELGYKLERIKQDEIEYNHYTLLEYPTVWNSIDKGQAPTPKAKKDPVAPEPGDDLGSGDDAGEPIDSTEELSDEQAEQKVQEMQAQQEAKANPFRAKLMADKQQYGDHILLYKTKTGNYVCYDEDAVKVAECLSIEARQHPGSGVAQVVIGADELEESAGKVHSADHHILIVDTTGDKNSRKVSPWSPATTEENEQTESNETQEMYDELGADPEKYENQPEPTPEPAPAPVQQPERLKQVVRKVVRKP